MKTTTITITHNLTPFHNETFNDTLIATLKGILYFWKSRSKKSIEIKINNTLLT